MPGYIEWALLHFSHLPPTQPEHSPHAWQKPNYGAKVQYADQPTTAPILNATDTKQVQEVMGMLLYYACAVDSTLITALGTITTQQAKGTQATMEAITQLLNYCITHSDTTVWYHASNMVLWIHSDASYLTAPKGQSCAARYHFLSTTPPSTMSNDTDPPPNNDPIDILCQIM